MQESHPLGDDLMPELNMQPRVFIRKMGSEYMEILGVKSFERNDHASSGAEISFVMAGEQEEAVKKMLLSPTDKFVDVKMEFSLGMLMVMTFSGSVEEFSDNSVCFGVSTPISTNVLESPENLH